MKKFFAILAAIVVLLLLSNPGLPAHQLAGAEEMLSLYYASTPDADRSNAGEMRIAAEVKAKQDITRKNFGIFSLTEYTFSPNGHALPSRIVGMGILGQVYIWSLAE